MNTIYENTVKGKGELASAFLEEKTIILFGDSAPDTLKDYCYTIDVKDAAAKIEAGQTLEINNAQFKIKLVGDVVQKNLEALGHISIRFTGEDDCLPGTIVVEDSEVPVLDIGSVIRILA
ncbi:MAG: PTS glucitol/sorbitol transporter subunit IIA [Lachnospiraceae bacterium]|nr:PTS glucitol/sorbitol transporter subunit IIA [Lachnospiraceae bacterium]